ncbi:MAG: tyrosine-type recombinase/integrase [Deltaproteobacteria bacterium]|nr:tyrosine-type recombinase/integrase [Deltaproteobacteria bacterium]
MSKPLALKPLFDSLEFISKQDFSSIGLTARQTNDCEITAQFLRSYIGSAGTFNSYRREVERLLHWTWKIAHKTIANLKRDDIENFAKFCLKPPHSWIGLKKPARFISKDGGRIPNPEWRPFVATISKKQHKEGKRPEKGNFKLSNGAIKEMLAILSSYFNYLLQEDYVAVNPVALIRQKSKFVQRRQGVPQIRRLTQEQWLSVIEVAEELAKDDPAKHERTMFIMSALYSMYLRISELCASSRWTPLMNHFRKDHDGLWWFVTVGKGNKERQIAVSDAMLKALRRWRKFLGLSALPAPSDDSPLLPRNRGGGPISSTTYLREIVQLCFDRAVAKLKENDKFDEADALMEATVHWLRHTGISDDVKIRPREHVRDDAGHSSSAITDKYIDIELKERHKSAKQKPIASRYVS